MTLDDDYLKNEERSFDTYLNAQGLKNYECESNG